ncbi:MAG: sigma-54 factor interaction domain-containing protein [Vicinamibacterales bacterium]
MELASNHSSRLEGGYSYYGLWHLHTRVRWLLRTNRAAEAVAIAMDALPRIERMADRNLYERMQLAGAEALGASGRPLDGAGLLSRVFRDNPDPSLDIVAEASRVAGCLAVDDDTAGRAHFERAIRMFDALGQRTASRDVRRRAGLPADRPVPVVPARTPTLASGARVVDAAAAVTSLAVHPPLLGLELIGLLSGTHAAGRATLIEEDATGQRRVLAAQPDATTAPARTISPHGAEIPLGSMAGRRYDLLVEPCASPTSRATLLGVERMASASVALSHLRRRDKEQASLWPEQTPEDQLGLVYASEAMADLVRTTRRIAPSMATVLITGETGAGKEVVARALHQASGRTGSFLPFNCTTVPRDMLDSQLFGYRRGAFTGAIDDYQGLVRAAEHGTLFLDEIGEMPLDLQPKLLRFLEVGEILPFGETRPVHVDVRVVAATNADLVPAGRQGRFREDLYYRLSVIRLRVPPLRRQREENAAAGAVAAGPLCARVAAGPVRGVRGSDGYWRSTTGPGTPASWATSSAASPRSPNPAAWSCPSICRPTSPHAAVGSRPCRERVGARRQDRPVAGRGHRARGARPDRAGHGSVGRQPGGAPRSFLGLSRKGLFLSVSASA